MEILKNDFLWKFGSHLFVRDYLLSENNAIALKIALLPAPSLLEGERGSGEEDRKGGRIKNQPPWKICRQRP